MVLVTPQLFQKVAEIIRRHHTAFVVRAFGPAAVTQDTLTDLQQRGLIGKADAEAPDAAYVYGQVHAHLEDPTVAGWSEQQVKDWVKKNPIPLTAVETSAMRAAQLTGALYVQGLGNAVEKDTGRVLVEADAALRDKLRGRIKDATAVNLVARETTRQLRSDLGHATQDWTRNLERVAVTEKQNAMQSGVADGIRRKAGDDGLVFLRPAPDACPDCVRLAIGPDGHPRIFRLSQLGAPGANVKRPKSEWVPCLGAIHPNCGCQVQRVPPGWGFNEASELVPGGKGGIEFGEDLQKAIHEEDLHLELLSKAHKLAGRMEFRGLDISIEQGVGDVRKWKDRNGETGETVFKFPYGYIRGSMGADGEHVDVYVGPDPRAEFVYVIHQRKKLGEGKFGGYDEDKAMVAFSSAEQARAAYLAHYDDPGFLGSMTVFPFEAFKAQVLQTLDKPGKLTGHPVHLPDAHGEVLLYVPTEGDALQKGGPYVGPRGGLWADAQHTIHWEAPPGKSDARHLTRASAEELEVLAQDPKHHAAIIHELSHRSSMAAKRLLAKLTSKGGQAPAKPPRTPVPAAPVAQPPPVPTAAHAPSWVPALAVQAAGELGGTVTVSGNTAFVSVPYRFAAQLAQVRNALGAEGTVSIHGDRAELMLREPQAEAPAAPTVAAGPKVQSFDEFAASRGVSRDPPSFPESHRAPGGVSEASKKAMSERVAHAMAEWQQRKDDLAVEYAQKVASGELRAPTREERLTSLAQGEGPRAEAAKRLLARRAGEPDLVIPVPPPAPEPVIEVPPPPPVPVIPVAEPEPPATPKAVDPTLWEHAPAFGLAGGPLTTRLTQAGRDRAAQVASGLPVPALRALEAMPATAVAVSETWGSKVNLTEFGAKHGSPDKLGVLTSRGLAELVPHSEMPAGTRDMFYRLTPKGVTTLALIQQAQAALLHRVKEAHPAEPVHTPVPDESQPVPGWDRMPEGRITRPDQIDPDKRYTIWTKLERGTRADQAVTWMNERTFPGTGFGEGSGKAAYMHDGHVEHGGRAVFPEGFDPNTGVQAPMATAAPEPPAPEKKPGGKPLATIPLSEAAQSAVEIFVTDIAHREVSDGDDEQDHKDAETAQLIHSMVKDGKLTVPANLTAAQLNAVADRLTSASNSADDSEEAKEMSRGAAAALATLSGKIRKLVADKPAVEAEVPAPADDLETASTEPSPPDIPDAMDPKKAPTEKESRQRAREVGKHLEASKKDQADLMAKVTSGRLDEVSYADAAKFLKKESLMPVLEASHYREMGASPGGAHMALAISAMVASKPGDSDEERKAYVEGVRMVAGAVTKIRTIKDAETFRDEMREYVNKAGRYERPATPEEAAVASNYAKYSEQNYLRTKIAQEIGNGVTSSDVTIWTRPNLPPVVSWTVPTEKEHAHAVIRALGPRFAAGFNISVIRDDGTRRKNVRWGSDTAFGKARSEAEYADAYLGWDGYENKLVADAAKEAEKRGKRLTPDEKQHKWKQDISELPEVHNTARVVEKGDAERLKGAFNFVGVQPGENIPDDEYEYHLRHAEMAFADLADVLGLPPEQVSLNGRLGVAFAARGRGKAAAHYEPDRKVINITRFKGAGTIAHEWGHFVDNIMAEVHGGKTTAGRGSFASERQGHSGMAPELAAAFIRLDAAINRSDPETARARQVARDARMGELRKKADDISTQIAATYKDKSDPTGERRATLLKHHDEVRAEFKAVQKVSTSLSDYAAHAFVLSGNKDGYWNEGTEMFARAFESYVQDKLESSGKRRNSYLVDGTRKLYAERKTMPDGTSAQRYPQGKERERINAAFDGLLAVMREGGHLKKALDSINDDLQKASGPYVGPRGGRWADVQHTVPWDDKVHGRLRSGVASVDQEKVREMIDELDFSDRNKVQNLGFTRITDSSGTGRTISVQVVPASKGQPTRGTFATSFDGGAGPVRGQLTVYMPHPSDQPGAKEAATQMRSVLAHELAHASDPKLWAATERRRAEYAATGKLPDKAGGSRAAHESGGVSAYLNAPSEVRAHAHQMHRELVTPEAIKRARQPIDSDFARMPVGTVLTTRFKGNPEAEVPPRTDRYEKVGRDSWQIASDGGEPRKKPLDEQRMASIFGYLAKEDSDKFYDHESRHQVRRDPAIWALEVSETWGKVDTHLDEENRKRFLRVIYNAHHNAVQGTATPMEKSLSDEFDDLEKAAGRGDLSGSSGVGGANMLGNAPPMPKGGDHDLVGYREWLADQRPHDDDPPRRDPHDIYEEQSAASPVSDHTREPPERPEVAVTKEDIAANRAGLERAAERNGAALERELAAIESQPSFQRPPRTPVRSDE